MKTLLTATDIAARVPHHGTMCLLHALHESSHTHVLCSTTSHHAADNPLRSANGLLSCTAIEYAAQAMALHGAMTAPADGAPPRGGRLASVRGVKLHVPRLDTIDGPLFVHAERLAGDAGQAMYQFNLRDERQHTLVQGRATVLLNPSQAPASGPLPTQSKQTK
jgi:predicted hotdog family 3-hydroxylacyl-ACP dehydratase